jgi:hypothetical protein
LKATPADAVAEHAILDDEVAAGGRVGERRRQRDEQLAVRQRIRGVAQVRQL